MDPYYCRMPNFGRSEQEHEHKGYFRFRIQLFYFQISPDFHTNFSCPAKLVRLMTQSFAQPSATTTSSRYVDDVSTLS